VPEAEATETDVTFTPVGWGTRADLTHDVTPANGTASASLHGDDIGWDSVLATRARLLIQRTSFGPIRA